MRKATVLAAVLMMMAGAAAEAKKPEPAKTAKTKKDPLQQKVDEAVKEARRSSTRAG